VKQSKKTKDLNLIESAILAGLPQRPSAYSPYSSTPDAYKGRTNDVLRRMREDGYIDVETEKELDANLANVEFRPVGTSIKAPHFVMEVRTILEEMFGPQILER